MKPEKNVVLSHLNYEIVWYQNLNYGFVIIIIYSDPKIHI